MNILIIPDSFKGSLTSDEVCDAIKKGILKSKNSSHHIKTIPFSDGGEGFSKCLGELTNATIIKTVCHDIYNIKKECNYYTFDNTAIIDTSTASGIQKRKNIMQASSIGTGELILDAYNKGFKNIVLGLGGTGCCDGGIGALSKLGIVFYDELYNPINNPKAIDMNNVFGISYKGKLKDLSITYACDVDNPYFGEYGAAYVFAPQKGARKTDVTELDEGLQRLNAFYNKDISNIKGCGAAGGICGGLYTIYGGSIKSGFNILSSYSKLEEKIKSSDIIITGEGKTDKQTLMGKLPFKISELAKKYNKKSILISGIIEDNIKICDKMISLVDDNIDSQYAMENAKLLLEQKSMNIL